MAKLCDEFNEGNIVKLSFFAPQFDLVIVRTQ